MKKWRFFIEKNHNFFLNSINFSPICSQLFSPLKINKMSSSSENKDFRQLDIYFNIVLDPSSSENKIMNIRSKLGITLFFCCIKDPIQTLNSIIQKMEKMQATSGISIILLSCACYTIQFIPHSGSLENSSDFSWVEAPLLRHAAFQDSNNMYNLSRFLQAGGAKMLPHPDVFLCELLLRYENIGISITAKSIGFLIDLNPETYSSILWRLFKLNYKTVDEIFLRNESFLTLVSKIVSNSKLIPPKDEGQLNILIKVCESNCQIIENDEGNQNESEVNFNQEKNIQNESSIKNNQNNENIESDLNNDNSSKSKIKQLKFHQVEISLTILRWLVSHKCYFPDKLLDNYTSIALDCLVIECWSEYAKYGDLSKLPNFKRDDAEFQSIYIKIIKNLLVNPNFSFDSVNINHWLWDAILEEFSRNNKDTDIIKEDHDIKNNNDDDLISDTFFKDSSMINEKEKHTLYDLTNNELMNCADIASILPEWFFIQCLRFKCRNSEVSSRLLKIISELPSSVLINNFDDFIDFIMFHIASFPQNANLISNCIRDLISVLLPRMNPLIEKIICSIDFFDELSLTPRLIVLNNIFCFGVETESFVDIFDSILESLPFLEGSISLSLCTALFKFFSNVTFYVPKHSEVLFNVAMAVICATYSSCALITSPSSNSINAINSSTSLSNLGSTYNAQFKRTMSAGSFRISSNSSPPVSPLYNQNDSTPSPTSNSSLASTSFNVADGKFARSSSTGNDSILSPTSNIKFSNNTNYKSSSSSNFGSNLINNSPSNIGNNSNSGGGGNAGIDFSAIDEPSFVNRCEQSHVIYTSCMRFYSVISSDIVLNPKYNPSDSFTLTPLALQLIQKLPINTIPKSSDGILMLIDFLPSLLPLFPDEVVSLTNFLVKSEKLGSGKHLSLISSQLKQELTHNNSFNLILQVIKFISLTNQESIDMKPVNMKSLPDDIDSARQALQADPEIIPLVIMKIKHISLLLELDAPKIDNNILGALSTKLAETNSCHELRQIRLFLSHFNFKQPECFLYDSWIRRDFSTDDNEKVKHNRKNIMSKEILMKNTENLSSSEIIGAFERIYPVDIKLNQIDLVISIVKNYKYCPELANIICSIVSPYVNECVRICKDKFWFLKFLFVHGIIYDYPQDSENEKCIEFGLRNGFLSRSLIICTFKINDNQKEEEEERTNINDDINKEWIWLDRLYLLLPSEIEEIWPKFIFNQSRILSSRFLPKQSIVPKDYLIKLIMHSSSLPSTIPFSNNSSPQNSSSPPPFFSTIPCCICQHILEYLLVFASNNPDEAEQFFTSNESAIVNFMQRVDVHNPLVFESLFTFVNSVMLMFGNVKKNSFVIRFTKTFLKIVFSFNTGIYSSCLYEVLPLLKKIVDVFHTYGKKLKPTDSFVQFLICLKKGIPSVREYIPDSLT